MDDGTLAKKSSASYTYVFNTQSFTYEEQKILQEAFNTCFGLQVSVQKDGNQFKLYIKQQSRDDFYNLILPFILESFSYKLKP
jgi:hypothetical protein